MNIGINSAVIDQLRQTSENTEHYLRQLAREGHDVKIVAGEEECRDLDLYVASKAIATVSLAGSVKYHLSYPDQVGTWWEIYNHIRYEL
jgi:hypothetical protein